MLRDEAYGWLRLGEVAPALLLETRLQAVWAGRLVSAVGAAHLPALPDDIQTSLEWLNGPELLACEPPLRGRTFRAAFRISNFSLVLLDGMSHPVEEFALDRRTLDDARVWLEELIAEYRDEERVRVTLALHDPPNHPVAGGRVFELEAANACFELARWYAGAEVILRELATITPHASAVRCWPEHLDLCTSILVREEVGVHAARNIVVGMSPGDLFIPEPYGYVALDPFTSTSALPALGYGAEWHVHGWVGSVLRARKLLRGSASGQRERLVAFLEESIAAARELFRIVA
jgi:hypothetical protein